MTSELCDPFATSDPLKLRKRSLTGKRHLESRKKKAAERETDRLQASTSHIVLATREIGLSVESVVVFDKNRNDRVRYGGKKRCGENRGLAAGAAPDRRS